MTFELPGARTFAEVTYEALAQAGVKLGLARQLVDRIIPDVAVRVEQEFALIESEHEVLSKQSPPECSSCRVIEGRLLRAIRHITLKDMLDRLKPARAAAP